jgi:hypothetical protein
VLGIDVNIDDAEPLAFKRRTSPASSVARLKRALVCDRLSIAGWPATAPGQEPVRLSPR